MRLFYASFVPISITPQQREALHGYPVIARKPAYEGRVHGQFGQKTYKAPGTASIAGC